MLALLTVLIAFAAAGNTPGVQHDYLHLPDGATIAYHTRPGAGPVLVLIPGSWGDYRVFDETLAALDPDLHVIIVELRGHGGSQPPTMNGSIEMFARDVFAVADALGLNRFYVGGHSIGGMVAIEMAGQRPEMLAGVISMEGWTTHEVMREAFTSSFSTMSPEQNAKRDSNIARVQNTLTQEQIAAFGAIWRRWNGFPILRTTTLPVLELWGDRALTEHPSRALMRIPDRPNIDLVWLSGASHSLLIERPREVAQAINTFTAQTEKRAALPDPTQMFAVTGVSKPDGTTDFSSLRKLPSETITIYRGVEHTSGFNMHPYIARFEGTFWAMWTCNKIRDLQAGAYVRYATSEDGIHWSESAPIMPGEEAGNKRYFARGFWIRDNQLIALAARDEAVRPLFAPDLELRGYVWNGDGWAEPIVIGDDAINNFPPERLPGGEWMMACRNHRMETSMWMGATTDPTDWAQFPISKPVDSASMDEPIWWALPDDTLAAAFRDGSKSQRLYRAFSVDRGRSWTAPVRTDFPDATAKFNVLRLRDGRYAMASCPNSSGVRIPICLSLSNDGLVFDRMYILRDAPTIYRYEGKSPGYAGYHYPQLLEHGDYLYVIHAENMEDIMLLRIALRALDRN